MKLNTVLPLAIIILFLGCASESNQTDDSETELPNLVCFQNNGLSIEKDFSISTIEEAILFLENPYKEINGTVSVYNLSDISFLSCLEKVRFLNINNCRIESLEGLTNIIEVSELSIRNMPMLKNLKGLDSIKKIDFLDIRDNSLLINLEGIESLNTIGGIKIQNNETLLTLEGLENVTTNIYYEYPYQTSLSWEWNIEENPKLSSISALNNIENEIKSPIRIYECPELSQIGVFQSIKRLAALSISNCASLPSSFNSFPNLTKASPIILTNLDNINSISFPVLEKLTYLEIGGNDYLTEINFNSLTEISGGGNGDFSMSINLNPKLTSINGINNLEYTEGIITVNRSYTPFQSPLENICAFRKLYLNQIANGVNDNKIEFKTKCGSSSYIPYSDISEFDSICECN